MSAQTTREWKARNKERISLVEKERYLRKREEIKTRVREYYERNREVITAQRKQPDYLRKKANTESARRARQREQFVEMVDREVVFDRDEGICGICGESALRSEFHVDHVMPLSRGGCHSYGNVQVAHPQCNMKKYNALQGG